MKRLNFWRPLQLISTLFVAFLLFTPTHLLAQAVSSGTLTGAVTDPTGALVPGATVTVTELDTKLKRTTVTNKDGAYVMVDINPGTYSITASKSGFQTDMIASQPIDVGTQTTANFKLAVGSESTTVEVQATNSDLQTMNSTVGDTVSQLQIESLPSVARDVSTFASLQPGVTPGGSVAGTVTDQAVFMVDGGNNSSDMDGSMLNYTGSFSGNTTGTGIGAGASGVMPMPQDSIEEFKVATAGQTADFNNSSGSQVQVVTKRGTSQFHGTAYEYYLDSSFGANSWSNNLSNIAKSIYHFNRFGVAAGGPIAPTFLGGKTYLFANYEGFRFPNSAVFERVVPSAAFEAGNITFVSSPGSPTFTAAQIKADDPRGIGIDPTVQAFWKKYEPQQGTTYAGGNFDPSANGCGSLSSSVTCDGINTLGYISHVKLPQTSDFFVSRVDHDFGAKWHAYVSYRYFNLKNLTSNQVDVGGYFPGDTLGQAAATDPRPQQPWYLVSSLTTNISSTFTNTFHESYLRNIWQWSDDGAPPPSGSGLGAALEPGGESQTADLAPINVNNQNIRTRFWDGHDHFLADDLTKLKGNHLVQFGGQFEHNFAYHQRTDNGGTVNYYPVYQLGETANAGLVTLPGLNANGVPSTVAANARLLAMNLGIVTDSQQVFTRSGNLLTLNPPLTPASDQSTILFYNMYVSDTWHARPSITVNFGLGYAIEKPPVEKSGKQVALVDGGNNPVVASKYLAARSAAASLGQVYNPELGFALIGNTANGGTHYPFTPFYKAFSPRLSAAWSPKFGNKALRDIFGEDATVIRGGYGRVYGRLNGVALVLNPLLGPGLIQSVDCQNPLSTGTCGSTSTDTTNFRIGVDGNAAPLPAVSQNLPQPFYPGYNGSQTSSAQTLDPTLRPSSVDSFNLTIQRQVTRKMLVEVGYIGRIIKNEYEGMNLDAAPYMLSVGGQTFQSAYVALEQAFGCATSAGLCQTNTAAAAKKTYPTIAAQPFFESSLAGSKYCNTALYANCTAGVVALENANIGQQKVWQLFSDLDNGGFTFPGYSRIMTQTPIPGSAFGATGQLGTGTEEATSLGYGNYNGGFISFKATNFHGITAQENFTYSKALGLNDSAQSSSNLVPNDVYDLRKSYGVQSYNQKFIFNTFVVYQPGWYKSQAGIVGRLLGGWTFSPIFTAGSGQPRVCTDNGSTSEAFGTGNGTFGDNENCAFTTPYTGGYHTHRGVTGGVDPNGITVGNKVSGAGPLAVNVFSNPVAVWNTVRPPILGIDEHDGGDGPIQGLPYWNMDLSVRKVLKVWERTSLEFSGISTNVLNHLVFANGGLTISSPANFGVVTGQTSAPRQIQMGIRASF
jgi:hypothetical protein